MCYMNRHEIITKETDIMCRRKRNDRRISAYCAEIKGELGLAFNHLTVKTITRESEGNTGSLIICADCNTAAIPLFTFAPLLKKALKFFLESWATHNIRNEPGFFIASLEWIREFETVFSWTALINDIRKLIEPQTVGAVHEFVSLKLSHYILLLPLLMCASRPSYGLENWQLWWPRLVQWSCENIHFWLLMSSRNENAVGRRI